MATIWEVGADQTIDWAKEAASALGWWRDAGVDVLVEDAAAAWLTEPSPALAPSSQPFASSAVEKLRPGVSTSFDTNGVGGVGTPLPAALADFLAWRIGEGAPEFGWHGPAIASSGPDTAEVMVLVDCPERDDRDLLGGGAGRLFDRMLAAIGVRREAVHLAAVCWKRPAAGRVPRDVEARLGEIARHHVDLVAPRQLILMGNAASRAMLSMELTQSRGSLRALNHRNGTQGHALATFHPRFLLERPAMKAEAWRDLLLIGGTR